MQTQTMTTTDAPAWTLGDRLAKARRHANIGSAEMAGRLHVSRTTITNYEAGRTEPPAHVVREWSEATGVSAAWLLGMDDLRSRCIREAPPDPLQQSLFAYAA